MGSEIEKMRFVNFRFYNFLFCNVRGFNLFFQLISLHRPSQPAATLKQNLDTPCVEFLDIKAKAVDLDLNNMVKKHQRRQN